MLYVVAELRLAGDSDWVVLDGNGEERERTPYWTNAIMFASKLTFEEQEAQTASLHLENTAGAREAALIVESYRRGQADAYKLVLTKLSFLLGGTLPRGGKAFRLELDKILHWLIRSEHATRAQADEAGARVVTPLAGSR